MPTVFPAGNRVFRGPSQAPSAPVFAPEKVTTGLTGKDAIGMTAGFLLCLVVAYTFGLNRILWEDEMFGWMLIHDPSLQHMIKAWSMGADGGGLTFYLIGRAWFSLFGASDVSFRLLSASCFGAAFCVIWIAARKFYSTGMVAFAMFNTWFFCPPMVIHMAEGRFYGLLILSTSLVIWLLLRRSQAEVYGRIDTPVSLYFLMFLCNGLLTASHTLGIVYSASLLLALICLDLRAGRLRLPLYLSIALSWGVLLLEHTALQASAQVGKPWFWTRPPTFRRFLGAFTGFSDEIVLVLFVLAMVLIFSWRGRGREFASNLATRVRAHGPVYFVVAALAAIPLGMLVEARFGTSLFIDRYLVPVNIGLALVTMELLSLVLWPQVLLQRRALRTYGGYAAVGSFAVLLVSWLFFHLREQVLQPVDYTDRLSARLPKGVPVLCEDAWSFTEIIGRQHASGVRYSYMLDWPYSSSTAAPRLEVTQYHLMENWRRVGYFSGSIQPRDSFLQHNPRFLVLQRQQTPVDAHGPMIGNPLVERFSHTPGYQVQLFGAGNRKDKQDPNIWLVCRGSCAG